MRVRTLRRHWNNCRLTPVFYHFTFPENVRSILADGALIPNKGYSICCNPEERVCLSDRMTQGLVEFCGNVIFEFSAVRTYEKNQFVAPRDYLVGEDDFARREEIPFFENEWGVPGWFRFDLGDVNGVWIVLEAGGEASMRSVTPVVRILEQRAVPYELIRLCQLPDSIANDTIRYFARLDRWKQFQQRVRWQSEEAKDELISRVSRGH